MTRYARTERDAFADELLARGTQAPTLCAGWTTADLAAHVVTRDRRPDAAAGILVPALSGYTDAVRRRIRDRVDWPGLVAQVRNPPWWTVAAVPPVDALVNTVEFFVHHEDVRRGRDGWAPRDLPADLERQLWRAARLLLRRGLRDLPADVLVDAAGFDQVRTGRGGPHLRLSGTPGELLLFGFGRQASTRVDLTGPPELVEQARTTAMGV